MTGDGVEIASIVDGVLDVAPGWEKVVDHAREELINRRRYGLGETEEVRQDRIGGCPAGIATCDHDLVVTLTVEPAAQALAEEVLEDWFAESEVDGSIVLLRNASGAVVAGAETATFIVPGENRPRIALWSQGRRQAGSLATPLAAVAALEAGYDLDSMWPASSPHEIPTPGRTPEVWTCRNAGGDGGPDEVTLREAIVLSITTAFCQLSADVGPEAIAEAMERIGVVSPLDAVLSIPLGTNSVGPLEMAASYATLVNDGERHDAVIIESVAQTDGTALAGIPRGPGVVVDPAIAGAIVDALQDVVSEGTGTNADIGRPVAGKTGTVQNYRDAWFVGSTPEYTAVVWVGYSESQTSMEDVEINGTLYRRVFGGTVPAPIWAEFMSRFLEGEPVTSFDD